jgi:hypothetical protein
LHCKGFFITTKILLSYSSHLSKERRMRSDRSSHFWEFDVFDIEISTGLFNDLADSRVVDV